MSKSRARQGGNPQRTASTTQEADARKTDEVEQGLAVLPEIPADFLDEVPPVEPETGTVTATRLKNLFDQVKQQGEHYKRAREKLLKTESDLSAKASELNKQEAALAGRETELAAAEKDVEAKRLAAKAGFVEELRETTKVVSDKIDAMLIDAATWGAESKSKALEATAAEREHLAAERTQLDADHVALHKRTAEVRALEADVSSTKEFLQSKEAAIDSQVQRRVELEITGVRDDLDAARAQVQAEIDRVAHKDSEIRPARAVHVDPARGRRRGRRARRGGTSAGFEGGKRRGGESGGGGGGRSDGGGRLRRRRRPRAVRGPRARSPEAPRRVLLFLFFLCLVVVIVLVLVRG